MGEWTVEKAQRMFESIDNTRWAREEREEKRERVATTHMEIWVSKHTRETCYLQIRDGQVWGCWIGRKGLRFRSLDQARAHLLSIGYTEVPPCGK